MKLSEFLVWWDSFVKANCEGVEPYIRLRHGYQDVFAFRFYRKLTVDGLPKILRVQFCVTLDVIDSQNGLDDLTGMLKEAVNKLKAEVAA